jgi:regulatory protein
MPSRPLPDEAEGSFTREKTGLEESPDSDAPSSRMLSWARNSASYRLSRRMHTEKQLRDGISRKAREKFDPISDAQVQALAAFAVKFAYDLGALDDKAYAEIASRAGAEGGKSKRAIARKLSMKGIDRETASAAVAEVDDLHAALVFARKRAFGPFRKSELDEKRQAKELSAFARAGFAFDVGKAVCEISLDEAETTLYGDRNR